MLIANPEAFLLVPLAALWLRRRLWPRPLLGVLRVLSLLAIAAVLAQPSWGAAEDGRDVVLVVDHSRSMPTGHLQQVRELAQEIADALPDGDRIGVVAFARGALVVAHLDEQLNWSDDLGSLDPDGSALGDALATAIAMIQPGRNATLLVCSDGEVPAEHAASVARLARRRGIRIDVQPFVRQIGLDVAVHEVRVPAEVPIESPFAINATVIASQDAVAEWRLLVAGKRLRSGQVTLQAGRNSLQLQHRLSNPGEQTLALEVVVAGDATPQNDRGVAVVRGVAKTRVLCVTPGGREDRLTRSLRAVGIQLVVTAPAAAPLTLAELDGFRAVVLEDVPAAALPQSAMRDLAHWVKHLGGGLLMTGGYNSYGVGGYYRSQLEDVLPVTMEIREEQRKFGLAMVIALDRSGSMRAAAGDTTKMQLANRGAATAVDLLSGMDAVSVLAVDTGPHIVQPLTAVDDRKDEILARVRSIESSGGGIYIGAALHAAAEQLAEADQENRHIVVFADASDAEEPDDYRTFLPELVAQGITVSTIGLGSEHGTDAGLLKEIATLGQGRCQFVADASELPRVFAQETIQVARSSLVEEPSDVVVEPSLSLLGAMPDETPPIAGYTVAWMRERAELDLRAERRSGAGEGPEPLLAHWQIGLGRTAAFLGEADGVLSGEWGEWPRYADFFGTLVRWLSGNAPAGLFVDVRRDGDVAVYELEVAADQASVLDQLHGVITEPDGSTVAMVFDSIANGRVQVRVPLVREGVHRAAVQLGGDTVRLPPVCLPYSAEWQLQPDPLRGEQILRSLAAQTAGNVEPSVAAALAGPRRSLGQMDVAPFLMWITLALLLLEIALRRLQVQLPNYASKWLLSRANKRSQPRVRNAKPHAATPSRGKQLDGMDAGKDPGSDRAAPDSSQAIESPQAGESPQDNLLSALERAQKRGGRRF